MSSLYLEKVFSDNELERAATTEDFLVVQSDGTCSVRGSEEHQIVIESTIRAAATGLLAGENPC